MKKILKGATLFLISLFLIGCTANKEKEIKPTMVDGDYSITTLPKELNFIGRIDNDSFICTDTSQVKFYSYNLKTNDKVELLSSSEGNFIKKAVYSNSWLVWIENDSFIENLSNKTYKWEIHAKNIENNTEISIDKSNFLNNNYAIPGFMNYTPECLDISSDGKIVYSKMFSQPNGDIVNKLIYFNPNDISSSEILSTPNVKESYISGLSIYNDKIVWSECTNYDRSGKLSTQFKNSYIYYYDINTKDVSNITYDGYYSNPMLNDKTIVAEMDINNQELATSNIVLIDVDTKNITNVLNKNSVIYSGHEAYSEALNLVVDTNDKYIAWQNLLYNNSIYDIENNTFINLLNDKEVSKIISINGLFDNYLFITVEKNNNTYESLCLELK